jgi:acetyl-CoA carboxylase carboxyltransferase component
MHCTVSGCGDVLVQSEEDAIKLCKDYLRFFPTNCDQQSPMLPAMDPEAFEKSIEEVIPKQENMPFDMMQVINRLVDKDSFFEMKKLFAGELITGFGRIGGRAVGIVANQPKVKGGVLFVDSADKAARFMWLCNAFNIPLLFLVDVPGFMIGTKVERAGIIRAGAKMVSAMSSADVPKISVVVRKAYGAGLYAMCGPAFEPDACLALPTAMIAVMGPEAAVNAVFYNKIQELPEAERAAFVEQKRAEYREDVDIYRLASELVIDGIIPGSKLRQELVNRFNAYANKRVTPLKKKQNVLPV